MRKLLLLGPAIGALLASGCWAPAGLNPLPVPPAPVAPAVAPPAPTPTPAPVVPTPAPAPDGLYGQTDYFGAGLPGAAVTARLLAGGGTIATATTDADGAFRLPLASVPEPVLVTARLGDRVVAAVYLAPAGRALRAATEDVRLEVSGTMAILALAPRLRALAGAGSAADRRAAALAAAAVPGLRIDPKAFLGAVAAGFDAQDALVFSDGARRAAAALVPADAASTLVRRADALARAIRDAVAAGATRPTGDLLGAVTVGELGAQSVFGAPASGNGGGSSGRGAPAQPDPEGEGTLDVLDGDVVDTPDPPTIDSDPG